jgi:hypothetical protein
MTPCNLLHLHQELNESGGCFFYPKNEDSKFVPDQPVWMVQMLKFCILNTFVKISRLTEYLSSG